MKESDLKCIKVEHTPRTATFEYKVLPLGLAQHNYLCAICRENKAVLDTSAGILQPCWDCQKRGYKVIKLNWIDKLFKR